MKQRALGSALFFAVALLSAVAALIPFVRGGRVNVVFFSLAVVFFVHGIAIKRKEEVRP